MAWHRYSKALLITWLLMSDAQLVCPHCQLHMQGCVLDLSQRAWCPRCGAPIADGSPLATRWLTALALVLLTASLSLLVLPLLGFSVVGIHNEATLLGGIIKLAQEGQWLPSMLVFLTALVVPCLLAILLLIVLFAPDGYMRRQSMVALGELREWCMLDILLVGLCVSMVKLADIGDLHFRSGILALVLGQLAMAALIQGIRPAVLWQRIASQPPTAVTGLRACPRCHGLNAAGAHRCWRCQQWLESRPVSGKRLCWSLLAASVILLIPANVLAMSYTTHFGATGSDTIFSGVITLAKNGSPSIAVIVFVASIVVPVGKILMLGTILVQSQRQQFSPRRAQQLYRVVNFIGRWSMLDIFVIAIMVTLVDQGLLSQFRVGPAATPFAMVVLLTMFAARRFDTRWLWIQDERNRRQKAG